MAYELFAEVYDVMMQDVPYKEWAEYILKIMDKFNCKPDIILDLGCGTGTVTQILAEKGYDMIGIDLSSDMLIKAKEKARMAELDILFLCQDMTEFELFGTVGCIISVCDSLNYILEDDELLKVFQLANNYLEPDGLFIFDVNTEYKFSEIMSENTFAQAYDNCAYIWDNYYYEQEKINEYTLTLFVEKEDNNYVKATETHYERAYEINKIKMLLAKAGLELLAVYHDNTFDLPKKDSERVYFVAREYMKRKQLNKQ